MPVSCTTGVSAYTSPDCNRPVPEEGGVRFLIWLSEDYTTTDFTNQAQWQADIDAGNIEILGPVVGSVPAATANSKKVDSCVPPQVTTYTRSVAFRDYNTSVDNTTFYNNTISNAAGQLFGYVSCAGKFYGPVTSPSLDVTRQIDENAEDGDTYWGGTVSYIKLTEETPVDVSSFFSDLNYS